MSTDIFDRMPTQLAEESLDMMSLLEYPANYKPNFFVFQRFG